MIATINLDGTITVSLTPQEQGLAQMILADQGATVFSDVFNLQFSQKSREVMNNRFAALNPADQATVLSKFAAVKG